MTKILREISNLQGPISPTPLPPQYLQQQQQQHHQQHRQQQQQQQNDGGGSNSSSSRISYWYWNNRYMTSVQTRIERWKEILEMIRLMRPTSVRDAIHLVQMLIHDFLWTPLCYDIRQQRRKQQQMQHNLGLGPLPRSFDHPQYNRLYGTQNDGFFGGGPQPSSSPTNNASSTTTPTHNNNADATMTTDHSTNHRGGNADGSKHSLQVQQQQQFQLQQQQFQQRQQQYKYYHFWDSDTAALVYTNIAVAAAIGRVWILYFSVFVIVWQIFWIVAKWIVYTIDDPELHYAINYVRTWLQRFISEGENLLKGDDAARYVLSYTFLKSAPTSFSYFKWLLRYNMRQYNLNVVDNVVSERYGLDVAVIQEEIQKRRAGIRKGIQAVQDRVNDNINSIKDTVTASYQNNNPTSPNSKKRRGSTGSSTIGDSTKAGRGAAVAFAAPSSAKITAATLSPEDLIHESRDGRPDDHHDNDNRTRTMTDLERAYRYAQC